ncbi:hypothetical protein Glove_196g111 [Diversispora epigaea]|uniref:Uncharacterized protein n=1 Tax=Diversispora epigaea TaxID=1348612 RepID=A0A397IKY8_9GLOM|nr:hypothetical protein Glove_196g111 [Diversispora epigaea]
MSKYDQKCEIFNSFECNKYVDSTIPASLITSGRNNESVNLAAAYAIEKRLLAAKQIVLDEKLSGIDNENKRLLAAKQIVLDEKLSGIDNENSKEQDNFVKI